MAAYQSDLAVITKAKELCSYVMTITDKSPKKFRFTLVAKLQTYALNVIENLYRANEVFARRGDAEKAAQRLDYQQLQWTPEARAHMEAEKQGVRKIRADARAKARNG